MLPANRRLPVTDDKRFVGMISESDLVRHLAHDRIARWTGSVCAKVRAEP